MRILIASVMISAGTLAVAADTVRPLPGVADSAASLSSLGMLDLKLGLYREGESRLRQAVTTAQGNLGEDDPATASYMTNLALARLLQGKYGDAATLLHRARFVIESKLGPDCAELVPVLAELTSAEGALGKFRAAEEDSEKALSILYAHTPAAREEILLTQVNLARLYLRHQRTGEAGKILPAAVAEERVYFKEGRILADGLRELAILRAQQHDLQNAARLYRESVDLLERALGVDHPDLAVALRGYAGLLKQMKASGTGLKSEVKTVEARARAIESIGRGHSS